MTFVKPVLDKSLPDQGDLVMFPVGEGLPASVKFGEVSHVHGTHCVVESKDIAGDLQRRIWVRRELRVILTSGERQRG